MKKFDEKTQSKKTPDTHLPTFPMKHLQPWDTVYYIQSSRARWTTFYYFGDLHHGYLQFDKYRLIQHKKTKLAPKEQDRDFIFF